MTYSAIDEVIEDRIRWAVACMAKLVAIGRTAGWLDGESASYVEDPMALGRAISARVGGTPPDVEITPMEWLGIRLELTNVELDALWLLVACELDPGVARLAQTFGTPECPDLGVLVWQRLVAIGSGTSLDSRQLERLVDLALVETTLDTRIPIHRRWIRPNDRVIELARGELRIDREIAMIATIAMRSKSADTPVELGTAIVSTPAPIVVAVGASGTGRRTLVRSAVPRGTIEIRTRELATDLTVLGRQLRAIRREATLFGVTPMLCELDDDRSERTTIIDRELLHAFAGPIVATMTTTPTWVESRPVVSHPMPGPSTESREQAWHQSLAGAAHEVIESASSRYAIAPGAIHAAAVAALARVGGDISKVTIETVHEGLRAHVDKRLGQLATRVDWRQTWDDLVLPPDQFEQIIELVARVRHRRQVLEDWGFGAKIGKGHGVAALLSGPPGTGKTMVAGLIAGELGLDLYQVDLSRMMSKYIGETEKNLATLFDAAESGHAVLLFDEADSLFGKRSEVKSSNDRYANLEVNYLLQRMETFTGISLLTTNHENAIDDAFRRRLALHVRFPVPDEEQREALWRAMLPKRANVDPGLDFTRLAREFEMSGGYIKNAVMRAAYLAADAGSSIGMTQLWKGARSEYEGMGKVAFQIAA